MRCYTNKLTETSPQPPGAQRNGDCLPTRLTGLEGCTLFAIRVRLYLSTSPQLFRCHPNLSDEVNRNFVQSEIEGGVFLSDLPPATVLEIQTQHHCYLVVLLDENNVLISGHPEYCPEPTPVAIAGSTWGGSMLKRRFVGRGMHLEFRHPEYQTPIVTSTVQEIREPRLRKVQDQHAGVDHSR